MGGGSWAWGCRTAGWQLEEGGVWTLWVFGRRQSPGPEPAGWPEGILLGQVGAEAGCDRLAWRVRPEEDLPGRPQGHQGHHPSPDLNVLLEGSGQW